MGRQLDKAREKAEQLRQRIKDLEAAAKKKQRAIDTRKKVLMGAYLEHWMGQDPKVRETWEKKFPSFLVRDVDREIFGFDKKKDLFQESETPAQEKAIV